MGFPGKDGQDGQDGDRGDSGEEGKSLGDMNIRFSIQSLAKNVVLREMHVLRNMSLKDRKAFHRKHSAGCAECI